MKILHILYSGLGGHGSVFFSMVDADDEHLFQTHALFNGIEDVRKEYVTRCLTHHIPYSFVKKIAGKHVDFFYGLLRAIRSTKPDLIFAHGSLRIPAAVAFKVMNNWKTKIIVRETQAMHMKTSREKLALKVAMQFADKIVFLSEEYREEVKKSLGYHYRANKTVVIPNGIDLGFFRPIVRDRNRQVVLGMQSRLVEIKDHVNLIAAMAILKKLNPELEFHLYIAGDGGYRSYLQDFTSKEGLDSSVTFMGMLNEAELPKFLQSLDIYIHASLGETMSTAIMQAMACALPVIASDVDGINNMIQHGKNGILVPVKNKLALAEAISSLATDNVRQEILKSGALVYAQSHFSNKRMFDSYKQIFLS